MAKKSAPKGGKHMMGNMPMKDSEMKGMMAKKKMPMMNKGGHKK